MADQGGCQGSVSKDLQEAFILDLTVKPNKQMLQQELYTRSLPRESYYTCHKLLIYHLSFWYSVPPTYLQTYSSGHHISSCGYQIVVVIK